MGPLNAKLGDIKYHDDGATVPVIYPQYPYGVDTDKILNLLMDNDNFDQDREESSDGDSDDDSESMTLNALLSPSQPPRYLGRTAHPAHDIHSLRSPDQLDNIHSPGSINPAFGSLGSPFRIPPSTPRPPTPRLAQTARSDGPAPNAPAHLQFSPSPTPDPLNIVRSSYPFLSLALPSESSTPASGSQGGGRAAPTPEPNPLVLPNDVKGFKKMAKILSAWIPDFSPRVSFVRKGKDANDERVDLIVENKRQDGVVNVWLMTYFIDAAIEQARAQAHHIFLIDPSVTALGCIIAIGAQWTYTEFQRSKEDILQYFIKDPSWTPDPDSVQPGLEAPAPLEVDTTSALHQKLWEQFGRKDNRYPTVTLATDESDGLLCEVEKRLRELNPDLWELEATGRQAEDEKDGGTVTEEDAMIGDGEDGETETEEDAVTGDEEGDTEED